METFSALLAICAGNSLVPSEFPTQRPVTRSFGVFFDLRLNKRLRSNRETGDSRRYRNHYDVIVMKFYAHGAHFVKICCWLAMVEFTEILKCYYTGTGAIK